MYGRNNPINRWDPTGLYTFSPSTGPNGPSVSINTESGVTSVTDSSCTHTHGGSNSSGNGLAAGAGVLLANEALAAEMAALLGRLGLVLANPLTAALGISPFLFSGGVPFNPATVDDPEAPMMGPREKPGPITGPWAGDPTEAPTPDRDLPDQEALSQLAKETKKAGKKGTNTESEAQALLEWSKEYGYPKTSDHTKNGTGNHGWQNGWDHIHAGGQDHIPVGLKP